MLNIFTKVFGSSNDRVIKAMMRHVNVANDLEEELSEKPDIYFKELRSELKETYLNNGKDIYSILPLSLIHIRRCRRQSSCRSLGAPDQ